MLQECYHFVDGMNVKRAQKPEREVILLFFWSVLFISKTASSQFLSVINGTVNVKGGTNLQNKGATCRFLFLFVCMWEVGGVFQKLSAPLSLCDEGRGPSHGAFC